MNQPLKTLLGILLIIGSFTFLVWKFLSVETSFGSGMLLNILGFLGVSLGLYLAGLDFNQKKNSAYKQKENQVEKSQPQPETKLKEFKEDDHDRYMPK